MKLTDNFSLFEFQSKDGSEFPESVVPNLTELSQNLEVLRAHFGKPVFVLSGYRSEEHNLKVGGSRESFHVQGKAADVQIKGHTSKVVYDAIESLIKEGKMKEGGVGLYKTFVHYDTRGKKIRWNYLKTK